MLRITKQSDYGIVLMTHFAAAEAGKVHSTRDLAAGANLPLPTASKILKALARAGLLASHRGVKGGYALARRPEDINLREVVEAVDGPIVPSVCCLSKSPCRRQDICDVFQSVNEAFRRFCSALEERRISDLAESVTSDMKRAKGKAPPSRGRSAPGRKKARAR